jgi:hypothetical protein
MFRAFVSRVADSDREDETMSDPRSTPPAGRPRDATPARPPPVQGKTGKPEDSEFWDAIALFEGILQGMPEDRVSLEALSLAYEQVGDLTRARDYLQRLAVVVARERDREAAELLKERLQRYAGADDPASVAALRQLEDLLAAPVAPARAAGGPRDGEATVRTAPRSAVAQRQGILRREMDFAWALLQDGDLKQEDYAAVVQHMTEMQASGRVATISVLHALQSVSATTLDAVLLNASRRSKLPLLPLTSFDPQADAFTRLPLEFMLAQGALAFERIGEDLLVAVLNPVDPALKRDIEAASERRCHFFLVAPNEFDTMAETIRTRLRALTEEATAPAAPAKG